MQTKKAPDHKKVDESAQDPRNSTIALTGMTEPRVDSRLIADHLGIKHRSIYALLLRYESDFKELGIMRFQIALLNTPGQPERYATLNEDQCYLLLTYSRNTAKVRRLKLYLVQTFREARQLLDMHKAEYLPTYHSLHDEIKRLAGGTDNERFVYLNVNRAINRTVGIQSGKRRALPIPGKSLLIVAQSVARNALLAASDHKEGYQAASKALRSLNNVLEGSCQKSGGAGHV